MALVLETERAPWETSLKVTSAAGNSLLVDDRKTELREVNALADETVGTHDAEGLAGFDAFENFALFAGGR